MTDALWQCIPACQAPGPDSDGVTKPVNPSVHQHLLPAAVNGLRPIRADMASLLSTLHFSCQSRIAPGWRTHVKVK